MIVPTQIGISGNLSSLSRDFLNERKQIVLNGQFSTWKNIDDGVPHGPTVSPLLFFIYIDDLSEGLFTS